MANKLKRSIQQMIQQEAPEWFDEHLVRLGNYSQQVLTSVAGRLYAREYNGKVIIVHNGTAHVPAVFDLHVRIGRKKSLPNIWQIIAIQDDYDTPAGNGQIGYHHTQHEFPNGDTVWVDRKQIVPLTVLVSDPSNFIVQVYGSVAHTASGLAQINTQTVNLSSYVVTTGAKFISIETNDVGVLSVHAGVAFGSPLIGTVADVPVPDPGKYLLAYVLMYEGQTALSNNDIRVPMPLGVIAKTSGLQIHDATADTPLDADEFGFWDVVDSLLKKITWANLKVILNTLYATLGHTHTSANVDFPIGHLHGLARWNGASGQSTFDLPDLAEYVESVLANGVEEDSLGYSLSSDRSQIVLDTALGSAKTVTAHYVVASM